MLALMNRLSMNVATRAGRQLRTAAASGLAAGGISGLLHGATSLAPRRGAVVARAGVAVEGESKPVQHLEGGIVREILVRGAQRVEEGEVLFRLEPVQAQANADLLSKQLDAALAQDARLTAERDDASDISFPLELLARRAIAETSTAIADQRSQFADHTSARRNELRIYT